MSLAIFVCSEGGIFEYSQNTWVCIYFIYKPFLSSSNFFLKRVEGRNTHSRLSDVMASMKGTSWEESFESRHEFYSNSETLSLASGVCFAWLRDESAIFISLYFISFLRDATELVFNPGQTEFNLNSRHSSCNVKNTCFSQVDKGELLPSVTYQLCDLGEGS